MPTERAHCSRGIEGLPGGATSCAADVLGPPPAGRTYRAFRDEGQGGAGDRFTTVAGDASKPNILTILRRCRAALPGTATERPSGIPDLRLIKGAGLDVGPE